MKPSEPSTQPSAVTVDDRRETGAIDALRVAVTSGPDRGRVHTAPAGRVVLGTHQSCDLVLTDTAVSRFHCELTLEEGRVRLRDLGSRNGTFIDGLEVAEAFPHGHSVVRVGRTEVSLDLGKAEAPALSARESFGVLVGTSPAMRRLFSILEAAAPTAATILLTGETGTGKEAAAESIHRESPRRDGPFIVVDCGAIPAELIESELFGHEKGAFTGAAQRRDGAFQAASGGTIFLDEIGELPLDLQPKLLRALERREVKRVGSPKHTTVDVRVIAATHRDLRADVNSGRFRSDLFYRLAVVEVRLPPLRERLGDLPVLLAHLERQLGVDAAGTKAIRDAKFVERLRAARWPGNVRELRNVVERYLAVRDLATLAETPHPGAPPAVDIRRPFKEARDEWTAWFERRYAEQLVEEHGGNRANAARAAGIDRVTFYRLLWRLGIR